MKSKVVDILESSRTEFATAIKWKGSRCPSCKTEGGWRIGSKFCLACVEWREQRPLLKRHRQLQASERQL